MMIIFLIHSVPFRGLCTTTDNFKKTTEQIQIFIIQLNNLMFYIFKDLLNAFLYYCTFIIESPFTRNKIFK